MCDRSKETAPWRVGRQTHAAPSALPQTYGNSDPGRWPGLLHPAPAALCSIRTSYRGELDASSMLSPLGEGEGLRGTAHFLIFCRTLRALTPGPSPNGRGETN